MFWNSQKKKTNKITKQIADLTIKETSTFNSIKVSFSFLNKEIDDFANHPHISNFAL